METEPKTADKAGEDKASGLGPGLWVVLLVLLGIVGYVLYQEMVFKVHEMAAQKGYAPSQIWLGYKYERGDGVKMDFSKAFDYYRMAADNGSALGQYNMAIMYRDGTGTPVSLKEAVELFRASADHGFAPALYNLGVQYRQGVVVPRDEVEAYKWISLAAEAGYPRARYELSRFPNDMSPGQLAEAKARAEVFRSKHQIRPWTLAQEQ